MTCAQLLPRAQVTCAQLLRRKLDLEMQEGDLVRHVKTDRIAVLIQLWEEGHNKGIALVICDGREERWFRSSTQVVS